jgi:hypothetical protein
MIIQDLTLISSLVHVAMPDLTLPPEQSQKA